MSKQLKKTGKKSRSHRVNTNIGDVTLADYADSACSSGQGRLKKAAATSVEREVKHLSVKDDDRPWDQKLEDFEGDFELVEEYGEDGCKLVVRKGARRRKKTLTESSSSDGAEYPLDIWFLLSEYIRPEDVATFSSICQSTLHVVSTAKFWLSLYRRYYVKGLKLPERLQPECMVRHYGLRACVIRSLYFMYPPFIKKAKNIMGFESDPHQLIKRHCVLVWHEKFKNQWVFCFKLRRTEYITQKHSKKPNLMELLDDVKANSEEGCKVLQVTCMNYVPTPMVLGQTLLSVSLTLDHGMRCKLQLVFGSGPRCTIDAGSIPVVLNPVMKIRVLDWWHPLYPHSSNTLQLNESSVSS